MVGSNAAGVAPVISLVISSSVYPTASFAATRAIGKPVAFEASADERETRGFISMTISRPSFGLTANCTLEPPVSTPISRSTAMLADRMIWYSLSVRVSAGATVIESPVCTPIGSTFSMLQMMMQLSLRSRTTSISYSFHPSRDSSIRTSVVGLASRPLRTIASNSCLLYAMPPPVPPSVKLGRMIEGRPVRASTAKASSMLCATPLRADSRPILSIASRNFWRSSALSMASASAPIIFTPYFARVPSWNSASAVFSAVCPPMVGSTASGRSFSMIFATTSGVIGSI